jgi:hypothetical protein
LDLQTNFVLEFLKTETGQKQHLTSLYSAFSFIIGYKNQYSKNKNTIDKD